MDRSDYEFSLRALDYWMDDLERVYKEKQDPGTEETLIQVDKSFQNIFKLFQKNYEFAMDNMSSGVETSTKMSPTEASFKREVHISDELALTLKDLIEVHGYRALQTPFQNAKSSVFLNYNEAEALVSMVIIEEKKASLKFPGHDKTKSNYNKRDDKMYANFYKGFFEKVLVEVLKVFGEDAFDHLF
jgi:hypothetical protein